MLGHLQSSMHQQRLTEATRIPEASWIRKHRNYIRHYVHTYKPVSWSLQGLDELWSTTTPECMSRGTPVPPGPPPSPPPLHFVTVPREALLWEQYKGFLYKQGVVDDSGNLITTTTATQTVYANAAQYRLEVGCKVHALVSVPGFLQSNYMAAHVGDEFQVLSLGGSHENRHWLWVQNASSEEGWIERAVVGKRGLPYYPWDQSFLGLC